MGTFRPSASRAAPRPAPAPRGRAPTVAVSAFFNLGNLFAPKAAAARPDPRRAELLEEFEAACASAGPKPGAAAQEAIAELVRRGACACACVCLCVGGASGARLGRARGTRGARGDRGS